VIDEVVLENPIVKGMPMWDLDRVRGAARAAGTLFGATPLPAWSSSRPETNQGLGGEFRLSYGTFSTVDLNGGIGGPLTDTLSMRFSGLYQSRSDWVDNKHTGENDALGGYDTKALRLQLLWQPNDKFSGLLNDPWLGPRWDRAHLRANILKAGTNDLVDGFEQTQSGRMASTSRRSRRGHRAQVGVQLRRRHL